MKLDKEIEGAQGGRPVGIQQGLLGPVNVAQEQDSSAGKPVNRTEQADGPGGCN